LCSPTDVSALTSDNGRERRIYKYRSCESDRLEYSCWESKLVESIYNSDNPDVNNPNCGPTGYKWLI